MNLITHLDFFPFHLSIHTHLPAHVSHVAHRLFYLQAGFFRQVRVINTGSVSHAVQETVNPLCRILSSCSVNVHREFHQTEPLGIGCLAKIHIHLRRLDFLVIRFYFYIIQKIMPLRNEFTDRTSAQKKQQDKQADIDTGDYLHTN